MVLLCWRRFYTSELRYESTVGPGKNPSHPSSVQLTDVVTDSPCACDLRWVVLGCSDVGDDAKHRGEYLSTPPPPASSQLPTLRQSHGLENWTRPG